VKKSRAIELLGNSVTAAAQAIGVTPSAVTQWPDELPPRLADRVLAALARKHLPPELMGEMTDEPPPPREKAAHAEHFEYIERRSAHRDESADIDEVYARRRAERERTR
jgi:hypothetical protein